jgi:hypothetical protein
MAMASPAPAPAAAPAAAPDATPAVAPATIFEAAGVTQTPAAAPAAPAPAAAPAPDAAGKLTFKDRPAWLPEKFHDPKTGEVKVEDLAKNFEHFRTLAAKNNKAPDTPDGYKLELADDPDVKAAAEAIGLKDDDPIWKGVREEAHAEGVSQAALNKIVNRYLKEQAGAMPAQIDPQAELKKLGQHGPAIVKRNFEFGEQMLKSGQMTQEEVDVLRAMQYDATGMKVISKLLEFTGAVPEIQIAAAQQAASSGDMATLDRELADIQARGARGENVQADFEANLAKRAKLAGTEQTRSWPPPS